MDAAICRRCRQDNRPEARYCASCGRPLTGRDANEKTAKRSSTGGTVVCWILFAVFLAGTIRPAIHSTTPTLARSEAPTHGLVYDLPCEYPVDHFDGAK